MAIKGGNLFFETVDVFPTSGAPGDFVTVKATVGNGAALIQGSDPDSCDNDQNDCPPPGLFEARGYCTRMTFNPAWGDSVEQEECINLTPVGVNFHTFEETFALPQVPSEQDVVIDLQLAGAGSGEAETQTHSIHVTPPSNGGGGGNGGNGGNGGGGPCSSNDDCPDGMVCKNGECVPGLFGMPRKEVLIAGGGIGIGAGLLILSTRDDDGDS